MIRLELDMEMPKSCMDCPFNYDYILCLADNEQNRKTPWDYDKRAKFCPLKEVKADEESGRRK